MPLPRRKKLSTPSSVAVERALNTLLEGYYPPPQGLMDHGLQGAFTRRQDDTDGERGPEQELTVGFSYDMDAWVMLPGIPSLRFRAPAGGGSSLRVHRALMVLAEAIRRDNEEHPQRD